MQHSGYDFVKSNSARKPGGGLTTPQLKRIPYNIFFFGYYQSLDHS